MVKTPKTFSSFRIELSKAMRKVGIDLLLCAKVADVNYEGDGPAQDVFDAWNQIEDEIKNNFRIGIKVRPEGVWEDMENTIHDCVINLVCDFWPAGKPWCKWYATAVVKVWLGRWDDKKDKKKLVGELYLDRIRSVLKHVASYLNQDADTATPPLTWNDCVELAADCYLEMYGPQYRAEYRLNKDEAKREKELNEETIAWFRKLPEKEQNKILKSIK